MDAIIPKPKRIVRKRQANPSPQEIEAECALIQSSWTSEEKMKRLRSDWRPTYRRCDGEHPEMSQESYEGHHNGAVSINDDLDEPQD